MPKMARKLSLPWIPCAAHVLNLVTSDALKVLSLDSSLLSLVSIQGNTLVSAIIRRHRLMVNYVRKSNLRRAHLRSLLEASDMPVINLCNDVTTRWNSTLTMLETNLRCEVALKSMFPERPAVVPSTKKGKKLWEVILHNLHHSYF